jgi:hypothetical protein
MASDWLNSPLDSSRSKSTKAWRGAIRDKVGTITSYRLLVPGPIVAVVEMA